MDDQASWHASGLAGCAVGVQKRAAAFPPGSVALGSAATVQPPPIRTSRPGLMRLRTPSLSG
ncbi:hypothetical protein BH24CHL4_BH24CHL4_23480 [soil metagenome]